MQADILLKRLQTFEFLRGLDSETLTVLADSAAWKVFAAGAVVFWEGDTESNLYYLQYGSLKVLKTSPEGREQVLRFINAGDIFNEVGVLAKKPNPATAIALEESGIWLIPRQALENIVLAHPRTALQIIENMADKIIQLVTFASDLSLKTVEARFAKLLLEQSEADTFSLVHSAVEQYRTQHPEVITSGGNATEREATILSALVKDQVITQEQADAFGDIHDRLGASGLMP